MINSGAGIAPGEADVRDEVKMNTNNNHARWSLATGIAAWVCPMFILPLVFWRKTFVLIVPVALFIPLILALMAVVLGHISRRRSTQAGETVPTAAIVGLTLGYLGVIYPIWENIIKLWALSGLNGMD